ncbi:hypothetical protein HMPREF2137_02500 [Hoylesella buccalis DNF00853]|uniref:Uncharacterized protein n=2 Tax=Hoylesella buccalis TaxID=28127 RepID=A0A095ZPQ6_9BACT|nr:hypothetical protein HMPREF2137_02500 [Hoylesella buccalis DNF00853]
MTLVILLLTIIAWVAWNFWPSSARQMKRSVAIVACQSWYEMVCKGKTILYFSDIAADTALVRSSLQQDSCVRTTYATGVWVNSCFYMPSCRGRMITVMAKPDELNRQHAWALIEREKERNQKRIRQLRAQLKELNYYLRIHNVHDEGYNTVAAYAYEKEAEKAYCMRLAQLFDTVRQADRPQLIRKEVYTAYYRLPNGECQQVRMREVGFSKQCQTVLLQTVGRKTPTGMAPVSIFFINGKAHGAALAVGYGGLGVEELATTHASCSIIPTTLRDNRHDLPAVLGGDGSPVFSTRGYFIGITKGNEVITRSQLRDLLRKEKQP